MQFERNCRLLRFCFLTLVAVAFSCGGAAAHAAEGNVELPRYPSISPDGSEIIFSWRGDLWKVNAGGGHAIRMTSHPSDDVRSAWSGDGKRIAFDSDRDGYSNLYIMNADGTGVQQLTSLDRPCALVSFGVDDEGREVLTFESDFEGDVYRSQRPYMVSTGGGDIRRVHDAFGAQPCVSSDGRQVAFTRGGFYTGWQRRHYMGPESMNVWLFDRENDSFMQLTQWDGNDGEARWGGPRTLLYMSDRELNCVNLWRMSADEGEAKSVRLTDFSTDDVQAFDVAADGSKAVLTVWDTMYTLDLNEPGAKVVAVAITASEDELDNFELKNVQREVSEAALSPDGKVMAMVAYGEVYVRNIEEKSPTRRVTQTHAREKDIAWSPDGLKLYFVSDMDGRDGIYVATVELTRKEAREGFEKLMAPKEDEAAPHADDAEEDAAEDDDGESAKPQASPEAEEGAEDEDNPDDAEDEEAEDDDKDEEKDDEEDPSDRFYDPDRWQDAVSFAIQPMVVNEAQNRQPSFSPDGKWLSYRRGLGDLMLLELTTGEARELLTSWDSGLNWAWGPDSKHIAYVQSDLNYNSDIWIVPIDPPGAPAVNVTQHPDNDDEPRWSADGKILSFVSERINEEIDLWMIYLDKDLEAMTPKELDDYYKKAAEEAKKRKPLKVKKPEKEEYEDDAKPQATVEGDKANSDADGEGDGDAEKNGDDKKDDDTKKKDEKDDKPPKPLKLDLEDAYMRVRRVTAIAGNEGDNAMTPAGDMYVFSADLGDGTALYSMKWNGEERKKISGPANVQHLTLTGDKVVFVSGGRSGTVKITGGEAEYYEPDDQIRIDLQAQSSQKFLEAARTLGEIFYHPTMKDLDWAMLTDKYHDLAKQARTAGEFNHIANRFLGELNASHLGIRAPAPASPLRQPAGRIGIREERVANGFRILEVVPDSPADRGTFALKVGDIITEIDFKPIGPTDTMVSLLEGKIGVETAFTIERTPPEGATVTLTALITPVGWGELRQLNYIAWTKANRALVEEWSEGRLGYFHMQAMGQPSLDEFERDLFAAAHGKDGLLMDVRNNGGGWTTDRVLSSIMVEEHAYTLPRGVGHEHKGHYPQDRLFIQRYTMPMNLLCNEKSFSNAEIMSHAFKTLQRGTLVGQETYGGVISTGGTALIDGTFVRLPLRGWFLPDGTDMENNGAVPHIIVEQTPEDEVAGVDAQLRTGVEDLLKRVD
jgi:tricorn protease